MSVFRIKSLRKAAALSMFVLLALLQSIAPLCAQVNQPLKPRLVIVLVADQFPFDLLARYQDKFGSGGFKYLMDQGAFFTACKYKQNTTQTATGHAVIATGAYPWANGIVANAWYDRRRGKLVEAVSDDSNQLVGGNGAAGGTRALLGTTIGDEMKLATNGRSKVVTVSLKDRASLLLAGRLANNAYWWDMRTGDFVSSSQYGHEMSSWVKAFNDQHYADKYFAKPWQRYLPENQYTASTRDDYPYERPLPGDGRQFPHVITGGAASPGEAFYSTFAMTPFANQMVADFAREAIEHENLGLHADADLLGINFSSGDYLGHSFGPYSQEVEDLVLRLDRTLSSFFEYLNQKVGLDKCMIVMTSDHGVLPIPEFLKEKGLDAGRIDPKSFRSLLDQALKQRLGSEDWIEAFEPPNLYLNLDAIDRQKYRQPDVEALAAKMAHSVPGVGEVYTAVQFFMNQLPASAVADAVKKGYYWGRSGELIVVPKPGYIFLSDPNGTTHGSPYSYDSHVPLILAGPAFLAGTYGQSASPADIAPTIAAVLGINTPALCEGRVLEEAMVYQSGPPRPRVAAVESIP